MKTGVNPDLIFWTGDNQPHNIWSQTEKEVISSTQKMSDTLRQSFANTDFNRLFPVLGVHDFYPLGQQEFMHPNSNLVVNQVADYWAPWLE